MSFLLTKKISLRRSSVEPAPVFPELVNTAALAESSMLSFLRSTVRNIAETLSSPGTFLKVKASPNTYALMSHMELDARDYVCIRIDNTRQEEATYHFEEAEHYRARSQNLSKAVNQHQT